MSKIMNRKLFLAFSIGIIFIPVLIFSQGTSSIFTLNECLNIAYEKGPSAIIAKENFRNRRLNYQAFKAGFYPQLSFTGSIPGLYREINTITQPDGSELFLPQSRLYSYGGLELSQKIPFTGGDISINSSLSRIDLLDNNTTSWRTTPFLITLTQPLFQYNSIEWERKIQDSRAQYNDKQFIEAMESLNIEVTNSFFNFYIAGMNIKNADLNLAINDTLYQLSQGRFKVGTIAENDLLHSELELANAQISLENARMNYLQAYDNLRNVLGMPIDKEFNIVPPSELPELNIEINTAVKKAIENNSELMELAINRLQAERELERIESQNSFNATLSASYGLNKSTLDANDLYSKLLDQERFNLNFSIPLFQWGKGSSEIEAALASQNSTEVSLELRKKEFEIKVKYEVLRFLQLQKQVGVAARSDTIASKRFEVAKNRYMIGKINMNDLFLAQREKDSASQSYFSTLMNFWVSYYSLRKLTLYDFEKNKNLEYKY